MACCVSGAPSWLPSSQLMRAPPTTYTLSGIPSASSLTPPSPNPGSDANGYLQEGFPGSSAGKESPVMQETQVQFLGWKDTLEK